MEQTTGAGAHAALASTYPGPDRRERERRAAASATEFARGQKFGRHEADEEVQRLKAQLAAITSAFDRLNAHAKANPLGDAVNDLLLDVYSPVHLWPAAGRAEGFQARAERLTAERDALATALRSVDTEWSTFWPAGPDVRVAGDRIEAISAETATIWRGIRAALASIKQEASHG